MAFETSLFDRKIENKSPNDLNIPCGFDHQHLFSNRSKPESLRLCTTGVTRLFVTSSFWNFQEWSSARQKQSPRQSNVTDKDESWLLGWDGGNEKQLSELLLCYTSGLSPLELGWKVLRNIFLQKQFHCIFNSLKLV